MLPREAVQARPRSAVEIVDDAWRICFADPLLLGALTVLFYLPAATCLFFIIVEPVPENMGRRLLLPALAALLLPLTGLSAGACQEAFHSWAEGYPVSFGECITSAFQRGLNHAASQAMSAVAPVGMVVCVLAPDWWVAVRIIGVLCFGLLAFLMGFFSLTRHASFAAGSQRFWWAFRYSVRASVDGFDRVLLLMLLRGFLLIFAIFNLHLFGNFALWAAENLGGVDVAYLGVLFSLGNAAYWLVLLLLAWCLLSPFHQACNYLFFVDTRTRREGLDLWNRVQELFPIRRRSQAGMILLALGAGLLVATPAAAQQPVDAIRAARQEIAKIRTEVKETDPYRDGTRWQPRLKAIAAQLEKSTTPGDFQWFRQAIADFGARNQTRALKLLDDLDSQLALVEDSLTRPRRTPKGEELTTDQIKNLIPPNTRTRDNRKTKKFEEPKLDKAEPPPADDGPAGGPNIRGPAGPGIVGPTGLGGVVQPVMVILVGLGVAILVAGAVYLVYQAFAGRPKATPKKAGTLPAKADDFLEDPGKVDPTSLWRQADERAQAGDHLGAVRLLYHAVLAMLHQAGLIRYERIRTNGEYADQLRPRTLLHRPFLGLTGLFEVKWYGERACASDDYLRCRELAEEIRMGSTAA